MLEAIRVLASYLFFATDNSHRAAPLGVALGALVALALEGTLARSLGFPKAILLSVGGLVLSRVALQFWAQPCTRIGLAAAAVVCWGWLSAALLVDRRAAGSLGIVAGLALDLSIRIAFQTVDLPWMPGFAGHAVTLLLAAASVVAAWVVARTDDPAECSSEISVSLAAVGPGLALHHLVTGNLGLAQVKLGLQLPAAASVLAVGMMFGVAGGLLVVGKWSPKRWRGPAGIARTTGPVALSGLGYWLFWSGGRPAPVGLVLGAAGSITLLLRALLGGDRPGRPASPLKVSLWLAVGMALEVLLLLVYYGSSGTPWVLAAAIVLLAIGSFSAGAPALVAPGYGEGLRALAAALATLLVAACGLRLLTSSRPTPRPFAGSDLTVMTYNIQSGFALDNSWSLERTARTIEAQRPDVVVLEEVSRGWLIAGEMDQALWLSRRLGMPYAFGANSDGGLWGNVILSRAPIIEADSYQYSANKHRKRGAVVARLEAGGDGLWVFGTHLAAPRGAGGVRERQARELLDVWRGREPALIAGDLNADPGDAALGTLRAAGFVDLGRSLGPSVSTSEDGRRIDYILATRDVAVLGVSVPPGWASDHRPVVARIRLRP
jgi:endonuclease/exonuclease/phosphatase family metal-dependent hydrolase